MYMKIGHHGGSGGSYTGITDAWNHLTNLGIPATFGSADHAGTVYELAQIARASGVAHNMFWRHTDASVPNYAAEPHIAALHHWQNLRSRFPPELEQYKDLVWIVSINEPDHWNHADWLGHFSAEISELMLDDGFKHLAFGWAAGTPEYAHWETEGVVRYLRMCAEYPESLGIALHEYSYSIDDIQRLYPYLLGRFFMPFEVCDELGIARPTTLITEWGWEYQDVPDLQRGLQDIHWSASLYYSYPQIKGAMGWYLGGGYGNIAQQFVHYITPMATMAEGFIPDTVELPIDPIPPNGINETLEQYLWRRSVERQIECGIQLNSAAALQRHLHAKDLNIVIREGGEVYQGEDYTIQAGEDLADVQPRTVAVWQPGKEVWDFTDPGTGHPVDPLAGFVIGPPFQKPFVLSAPYGVPRDYDGDDIYDDLHEGADYDIVGEPADSKEPVLCGVNGDIVFAGNSGGAYGWFVIVETEYNGYPITLWYCHMDTLYVQRGQKGYVGTQLGELGDTGGNWAEHVHLNMQVPGLGSQDPRFPIADTVDPHPYVDMRPPPAVQAYDLSKYLFPTNGNFGDIIILQNNWGQGDERTQLQRDGNKSYVTKNQQYEQRHIGDTYISLELDTSPGGGNYYTVQGNWLPRYMRVGEIFRRTETVENRRKSDCSLINSFAWTTELKFMEHINVMDFNGVQVVDVVRFAWYVNGVIEEEYWYGAGTGLVQWQKANGNKSWIREIIPVGSQHNNVMEVIPCL